MPEATRSIENYLLVTADRRVCPRQERPPTSYGDPRSEDARVGRLILLVGAILVVQFQAILEFRRQVGHTARPGDLEGIFGGEARILKVSFAC